MPNKTLVTARKKEAKGLKKPKYRVILMACTNATGSIRLPLLFILKSLNPICFKNVAKSTLPVEYYAQKNSWMDSAISRSGSTTNLFQNVRKHWPTELAQKALPLLDNAPSHPDIDCLISDDGEISCLYLPLNTTSLIQPGPGCTGNH